MGKIDKLKEGDLVVHRDSKRPYIVLEISKHHRVAYGSGGPASSRKKFLLLFPDGRQRWKIDTALKVEYYLPGDPWFDDIR
tara:strand:- start:179 stop:421 length:243 start_codon:yes stop_codon:yes gene_type:complete